MLSSYTEYIKNHNPAQMVSRAKKKRFPLVVILCGLFCAISHFISCGNEHYTLDDNVHHIKSKSE